MANLSVQMNVSTLDVLVQLPDGSIGNPIAAAIIDLRSRKVLASRVGVDGPLLARETLAEVIRLHGIPAYLAMGSGCETIVAGAMHEELHAHRDRPAAPATSAPTPEGRRNG